MKVEKLGFAVFTKPWGTLPLAQLAEKVHAWGFHGIEFPLRDGFQVEPRNARKGLLALCRVMGEYGLRVYSVASSTEEPIFAACAEAGVPMIRIMLDYDPEAGFRESEKRIRTYLEGLLPLCETYGVKVGIQPHSGKTRVKSAAGLLRFLEGLPPQHIGAIWDAAHDALCGEGPEIGIDMLGDYLCMVNLKNAYYQRLGEPSADGEAKWKSFFTTARDGMASWSQAAETLIRRSYEGVICLTAEYSDETRIDEYIAQDLAYAKKLFRVTT